MTAVLEGQRENICRARHNKTVSCEGEFIKSEGLCFRHACLFDIWICRGGWKAYAFTAGGKAGQTPTKGETNPAGLRNWKRAQFYKWLDTLTPERIERLLRNG